MKIARGVLPYFWRKLLRKILKVAPLTADGHILYFEIPLSSVMATMTDL
jgi:hypothetical protein